jgi:hypothetical protein
MTAEEKQKLFLHLEELRLEKSNTDDFVEQLEIADQIHTIEMKLNGVKPTDSYFECEGCGS